MNQTRICLKEETETTTGMPTQKIQQRRERAGQRRVRQGNHHPAPPVTCTRTHTWTRRGESKAGKTDRPRGQAGPDQTKAGRRRQDGRKTTDPPSKAPLTAGREGGGAEEGRDRRPQGRRSVGGGEKEGGERAGDGGARRSRIAGGRRRAGTRPEKRAPPKRKGETTHNDTNADPGSQQAH